ncbi:type I-G CRISPR-associated protein Csb2 [Rhodoblastus sp.]|uniref:type I-G CRISPR-associated protein Csb2 n=1 Tax=Rhodoblastus sp. TaxID=1962975 RepID=UPI003F9E3F83
MPTLLFSVRFHDGRYHGGGEWPPSPARLFQALVAGAARGGSLCEPAAWAFRWLEGLAPPVIAAPPAYVGRSIKNFVPNNDLDAVGGDPARIGEIRTAKIIRPRHFDAASPLLYAWTFERGADADRHAQAICEIADDLYQLGRGVDMAWAQGETLEDGEHEARLCVHGGAARRPSVGGGGALLSCPHPGSLASLIRRFAATRERFKTTGTGRKSQQLFSQAPKPDFRQVPYNSPSIFPLFDIRKADADEFSPQSPERVVALTEKIRDQAAAQLKKGLPDRAALIDRVFVGRDANEADKAQRICITPLPSIGHPQAEQSIRRVLVAAPPDCPIAPADIAWAFSGLVLDFNPDTGEVQPGAATLATADDRSMLDHYGVDSDRKSRLWRTVTPVVLSERAARRRIDPRRTREEAKDGAERLREHAAAEWAVRQALRHAGVTASIQSVRVQREPFEAKGQRAEVFAPGTRFAKERLWHVEIAFAEPSSGPLLIGDGRYLGLGLTAPVRRTEGVLAFAIADGLASQVDHDGLARALRRAVMARVQARLGPRAALPVFFSGHEADGAKAGSGRHAHLAFAFDAKRNRLIIVAPHLLGRREAWMSERENLSSLDDALADFRELRAGEAGMLTLVPCPIEMQEDPLFASSRSWESLTPYRVTRHAKMNNPARALEADLLAECRRGGLPRPEIEIINTFGKTGLGLFGRAKLTFHGAVAGPILIGRDRHFGGGLFAAAA